MMRGYDEIYLEDSMRNLGEAFDYAVNVCHISSDEFLNMLISSGISDKYESGSPKYVTGMSGTELALDVLGECGDYNVTGTELNVEYECSPDYWSGWILAYFQWYTGRSFRDIHRYISMKDILKHYSTLHEACDEKSIEVFNDIIRRKVNGSNLQNQRKKSGYSQSELSRKSGVNLRTLQQYEVKGKNINKASVSMVISLARTLGCRIEDILEYDE